METLLENGFISDEAFEKVMTELPAEKSSFNKAAARSVPTPTPSQVPVNEFRNLNVSNDAPPAYNAPSIPAVPSRQPSAPPSKPEIGRAVALYRYTEPDDCTFEVGDNIVVFEHMNNEWWLGKNLRTGKEGVFPVNYVQVQHNQPQPHSAYGSPVPAPYGSPAPQGQGYYNEKANNPYNNNTYGGYPNQYQQSQYQQPPPGPSNPYNADVPPVAVAEHQGDDKPNKGADMGKKFGKKLGNAAIFGAGATIGGNIVNSIF